MVSMNYDTLTAWCLLDMADNALQEAELINDSIEGWLNTKRKPSEELEAKDLLSKVETLRVEGS